uniref:Uncharacterized protein n=1 Tax=Cyanoptyche gloeocystis TaxID=77922 RepID=A0A7S2NPX3_9EUKA|mmetsp:Transcript_205/g.414  ORF Transcript_205/g.414 Transcript_205/m.414 type:complete len:333 (+) Transcript_205:229-1227(+)
MPAFSFVCSPGNLRAQVPRAEFSIFTGFSASINRKPSYGSFLGSFVIPINPSFSATRSIKFHPPVRGPERFGILTLRCENVPQSQKRSTRPGPDEEGIGGFFVPGLNGFRLRVGVGCLCIALLCINRFFLTDESLATVYQFQSEIIGILASSLLIVSGVFMRKAIATRSSSNVLLEGKEVFEFSPNISDFQKEELAWSSYVLFTQTNARSILFLKRLEDSDSFMLLHRRGFFSASPVLPLGPLGQQCLNTCSVLYVPHKKLREWGSEFSYLPRNIQDVLLCPMGPDGLLVLGTDVKDCFSPKLLKWIQSLCRKLESTVISEERSMSALRSAT